MSGSSPLTRGKRVLGEGDSLSDGLIPAHAGKTCSRRPLETIRGAHPRSRGENYPFRTRSSGQAGSSPLTRGKRGPDHRGFRRRGLIPAHAGKTRPRGPGQRRAGAHPRSRGENLLLVLPSGAVQGSSPLTRGKLRARERLVDCRGLIPAHAGKTQTRPESRRPIGAHPRSRGENTTVSRPSITSGGSSPLTRGKRGAQASDGTQTGLIPAHAGKTHDMQHDVDDDWGSSPLTRGKPTYRVVSLGPPGLIPAHAGKTFGHSPPELS